MGVPINLAIGFHSLTPPRRNRSQEAEGRDVFSIFPIVPMDEAIATLSGNRDFELTVMLRCSYVEVTCAGRYK
ncbi:MAG: hypothetical protein JGK17_05300 [Microcoleus sp. PH2017_10_PVI_O_A]|uniref:hypothetical protein n=1 Tax=unclassified Microcoleus TaxID=2642155 RepID=UPI001DB7AA3E|nr:MULTISPECIES: hypothetical protein [unclassified Microcoleus]MCC3405003.1 hypothetical protein [Microcoleus sp. PH2017_10_PVI_O_A]MCC3458976.1 hypothetical protein [Microcoleus sp. PH2017_11_PCY_U_A]MCC3477809.1 hypothetical protein [Microcoleus sp. PH2017_12_PCY_D_A]MCC3558777.1 hypothetical protein [Microcoleus sp. PH2017_27_LUM_O_A]